MMRVVQKDRFLALNVSQQLSGLLLQRRCFGFRTVNCRRKFLYPRAAFDEALHCSIPGPRQIFSSPNALVRVHSDPFGAQ